MTKGLRFIFGLSSMLSSLTYSSASLAWGHTGHQKLAEVAATLTTDGRDFWVANMKNLGVLANVPDVVWKSTPNASEEKPTHFFQPDSYAIDPRQFDQFPRNYDEAVTKYSVDALDESGTATWRAQQLYGMAVTAFKNGDFKAGLEYAGTMSHYVGDLSQPLHVTKNYDGQETGDKGIHSFFETKNIQAADADDLVDAVTSQAQQLLGEGSFINQTSGKVIDSVFNEVNRAYSFKDAVIKTDLKKGRTGAGAEAQLVLAESRLADGAATLSILLSQIWREAGSPSSQDVEISTRPQWVKPDYSQYQSPLKGSAKQKFAIDDDCEL